MILVSDDGFTFRSHSQLLQLKSRVMADLLEEHSTALPQAPGGEELRIPFGGPSQQLHLVLQVCLARAHSGCSPVQHSHSSWALPGALL